MPTDTYREEAKGVSNVWYAHRERLPKKSGIRIYPETYERVKESIKKNGLRIHPKKFPFRETRVHSAEIYSFHGLQVLINELLLKEIDCDCIKHTMPEGYLTISAKNEEDLEKVARKLNLPLEARVE